jgi:hypothetical protein
VYMTVMATRDSFFKKGMFTFLINRVNKFNLSFYHCTVVFLIISFLLIQIKRVITNTVPKTGIIITHVSIMSLKNGNSTIN